ncbi:MAG: T9SS type A sorting domain-containing protein [Flavobacteriales bacterium]|nr:T9SS type A sorting domain-containing protein [Flavobacteriales bacterium]
MKNHAIVCFFLLFSFAPLKARGQVSYLQCNGFDNDIVSESVYIELDSSNVWELGFPSDSLFGYANTIPDEFFFDTEALNAFSDTSAFYAIFKDNGFGVVTYLGYYVPLSIEFDHRFITDSGNSYGMIDMSFDDGVTWYDVLSDTYNTDWTFAGPGLNEHYFEGTGDTRFDSLAVVGNSNGTVHSVFTKEIDEIITNDNLSPDSLIVRFRFIADSTATNVGWQIDNICMQMDTPSGIQDLASAYNLSIYPNPSNGSFRIEKTDVSGRLFIYNNLGEIVYAENLRTTAINVDLEPGLYQVVLEQQHGLWTTRVVIE